MVIKKLTLKRHVLEVSPFLSRASSEIGPWYRPSPRQTERTKQTTHRHINPSSQVAEGSQVANDGPYGEELLPLK
jgi:hypothetical protein